MKKILRLLRLRNKSGFTLVEVIISSALLGILIMAMVGIITPVMSVITNNENNANALLIAEAAEAYIDRSIKNSVYTAIFTNANENDILLNGEIYKHEAFKEMKDFLKDGDNMKIYDLNIIGIRWLQDPKTLQNKYMLQVIKPTYDSSLDLNLTSTIGKKNVFEPYFYDGMYPEFEFEVLPYDEHTDKTDPTKITATRGATVKTTANIYSNPAMTALAASGTAYSDFVNIRTPAINRDDLYKLYYIDGVHVSGSSEPKKDGSGKLIDNMDKPITITTELRTADECKTMFSVERPDTYIFYVTRKLKYYEPPASP